MPVNQTQAIIQVRKCDAELCTVPADWGWWPTSEGGLGAIMGVWLRPFSAGTVTLWSTLDSEGASLPASTCHQHSDQFSKHTHM